MTASQAVYAGSIPVPRLNIFMFCRHNKISRGIGIVLLFLFCGCATTPQRPYGLKPQGVYHTVGEGETLWRIAQAYGVPIEDIIRYNNIPNAAHIEKGQLLFIPGATKAIKVFPEGRLSQKDLEWPLRGKVIAYFGEQRNGQRNRGINIAGKEGDDVLAARDGRVVFADYLNGYGYTVILDHGDGVYSVYSQHNAELKVHLHDYILKGSSLAKLGKGESPVYLHFEILEDSKPKNPLYYLP